MSHHAVPRDDLAAARNVFLTVALATYLLAFVCPDGRRGYGLVYFVCGYFILFDLCPVWLANPALWIGIRFLRAGHDRAAFDCGLLTLVFGLSYLPWRAWSASGELWTVLRTSFRNGEFPQPNWELVWNDLAFMYPYYFWMVSMLLFTLACLLRMKETAVSNRFED